MLIFVVQVHLHRGNCTQSLSQLGFKPMTSRRWTVHLMSLRRSTQPLRSQGRILPYIYTIMSIFGYTYRLSLSHNVYLLSIIFPRNKTDWIHTSRSPRFVIFHGLLELLICQFYLQVHNHVSNMMLIGLYKVTRSLYDFTKNHQATKV